MPRRAASFTQADLARAIRAAKHAGADRVEVRDGAIVIVLSPESALAPSYDEKAAIDDAPEIIL
jgi:hypothetical protein